MKWNEFRSSVHYLSLQEQKDIEQAFELGKKLHRGQKRFSGEPYFTHPIAVARMLADMEADRDTIIAALLHDAVEDTDITLKEIETQFNGDVASLIDGVTKFEPEDMNNNPNLDDQIETLRKMFDVLQKDVRIVVIKLIDRLHNMQTIEHLPEKKKLVFAQETYDVFAKVADRLCMQDIRDELEQLSYGVLFADWYKELVSLRMNHEKDGVKVLQGIQEQLHSSCDCKDVRVMYEHQSWETLQAERTLHSAAAKGFAHTNLVFVCPDVSSSYCVLGFLHQGWQREEMTFEDFINAPQLNGYRGLHTTIILEDGTRVRCKIRTTEMHVYARKGVSAFCFDSEAKGYANYLPWTKRINAVSQDTSADSAEFLQSLQSDILGNVITVYSTGEKQVRLPEGATALDGAVYVYGKKALRMKKIYVNGKEVSPWIQLQRADVVSLQLNRNRTVQRAWLKWVSTGTGIAIIRTALGEQSEEVRIERGKAILQQTMHEHERGFLEDYNFNTLQKKIHTLGYVQLNDLFADIGDGRLDSATVYTALFSSGNGKSNQKTVHTYYLSFDIAWKDIKVMQYILRLEQILATHFQSIRINRLFRHKTNVVHAKLRMSEYKEEQLKEECTAIGASNVRLQKRSRRIYLMCTAVFIILLWNIDPAFAKYILHTYNVTAADFTIIRFSGFACFAVIMLAWQRYFRPSILQKLALNDASLWIGAISFMLLAFTTYLSLYHILPQDYQILVCASAVLIPIFGPFSVRTFSLHQKVIAIGLVATGVAFLKILRPSFTWEGFLYAILMTIAFTVFSISINNFKESRNIGERIPVFLSTLSLIALGSSLFLLPFSSLSTINISTLLFMFFYSIVFLALPYYLYYNLMKTEGISMMGRMYPVGIIFTLIAQYALFHTIHLVALLPLGILYVASSTLVHDVESR